MSDTPRRSDGEYEKKVSDAAILRAVQEHDPAATSEVADAVGITRQAADYRLRALRDDGRVSAKKVGRALVWFDAELPTGPETPDDEETDGKEDPLVAGRGFFASGDREKGSIDEELYGDEPK